MPTNVVRFHNALVEGDAGGVDQRRYYHPGIGTEEVFFLERIWAGMTGAGLSRNVKSAYRWLAANYDDGDEIYLAGFSRGAFTVRSLSGLISRQGLPREDDWRLVESAYKDARRKIKREPDERHFRPARIHFLGVWDTVGALGIPPEFDWLPLWLAFLQPRFHDTELSPAVTHAYHALAVDEMRRTFSPTLWTRSSPQNKEVVQMWFAGVHADVGGGYRETGLSDVALDWMTGRAAAAGAAFRPDMLEQIRGDHRGVLHDSRQGAFKGAIAQPRRLPNLDDPQFTGPVGQQVHLSVLNRIARPPISQAPYYERLRLAPGAREIIPVYARDKWNWTGIYVQPGEAYEFSAAGEWMHWFVRSGPEGLGWRAWLFPLSLWRRYRRARWLSLVGAVADFANPDQSGRIRPLETFAIGAGTSVRLDTGAMGRIEGYLYLYANDREGGFALNRGSVQVTVRRTA